MDLNEAYSVLGVNSDVSEKDLNKAFKKLAAKYHPDVNKDSGAEDMFKKINAANDLIKESKNAPPPSPFFDVHNFKQQVKFNWQGPFGRPQDIFGEPLKQPIELKTTISFAESVLGCSQKISFDRDVGCKACKANGFDFKTESCTSCSGQGHTVHEQTIAIGGGQKKIKIRQECFDCEGNGRQKKNCTDCSGTGEIKTQTTLEVKIPGGIVSGQKMKLSGQGHHVYRGSYDHAYLLVEVTPTENMMLAGQDVISNLEISLLDALKGSSKTVQTVYGEKSLDIPPVSKNKDRISVPEAGVDKVGDHVFILDIMYPSAVDDLIKFLEDQGK